MSSKKAPAKKVATKPEPKVSKPNKANSLVMVYYSTTAPRTTILNRSATGQIISRAQATKNSARVYNTILNTKGTAIGRAVSLQNGLGEAIRKHCLPCPVGGYYTRVRDIELIQNLYDDALVALDDIKDDIIQEFPDIISRVRQDLGKFAEQIELPTATEVSSKFTITLRYTSEPAALDGVMTGLSAEVANRVAAESRAAVQDMLRAAHAGPLSDLRRMLNDIADKLRNAERLHLTQFDHLASELTRVAKLNVLDLPEINDILGQTKNIVSQKRDGLSNDDRVEIAAAAESTASMASSIIDALGL
jgi:hypothetical protein